MRQLLLDEVRRSVKTAFPEVGDDLIERLTLDPPRDPSHGDFSSNVAFLLKDVLRANPRQIAETLVEGLGRETSVGDVEVAGAGFINFRIRPEGICSFLEQLADARARREMLLDEALANRLGLTQIEFVSANPTGPMNVVSARAAAFGDSLVRLLRAVGADARSEFYVNDVGNQARIFGRSLRARFLQAAGRDVELEDEVYRGDDIVNLATQLERAVAARAETSADPASVTSDLEAQMRAGRTIQAIAEEWGEPDDDAPAPAEVVDAVAAELDFAALGIASMVASARESLARFGVEFDEWFRESSLHREDDSGVVPIEEAEKLLNEGGHVRRHEGAYWFRSTEFGDDKDRVIRRADGDPTYLLGDIAYHLDKARRGFRKVADIWGPDHHGYIKRLHAATVALGQPEDWLSILIVQQVNLLRDGEPVKMSKREGEIVTLDELLGEVGKDVSRFFFLMRRASAHLDFDLELAKRETMDNPVFYVQYAHARSRSIFRQPMAQELARAGGSPELSRLDAPEEIAMMRILLRYPEVVQESARALEPHRLVGYLREVAGSYHRFYTRGKQEPAFRVLGSDEGLSRARLFLVGVLADVLREGLDLLGIEAVESM
jgi:arginyl-tRNA synthetase